MDPVNKYNNIEFTNLELNDIPNEILSLIFEKVFSQCILSAELESVFLKTSLINKKFHVISKAAFINVFQKKNLSFHFLELKISKISAFLSNFDTTKIKTLNFEKTIVDESYLKEIFQKVPYVKKLNFKCCSELLDSHLEYFQSLSLLEDVDFSICNRITNFGLTHLKNLHSLTSLDFRLQSIHK